MSKNDGFEIDGGWVATAIMLAVFFPIGLVMLWDKVKRFKRGKNETKQMATAGTSLVATGIGMTVFGFSGWGVVVMIIGGLLINGARQSSKREKRYMRYMAIIGGRPVMPIADIAAAIPVSIGQAARELQNMIELGYFGLSAYIDKRTKCIVLDGRAPEAASWKQPIYAEPEPEPAPEPEPVKPEPEKPNEKTAPAQETEAEDGDQFGRWITAIREVNERIDDQVISDKIDRIERLTARIFEMVRSRPDKEGQIRKFMNYYLPTTVKLLDSYALLEAQGIEGDNITASKRQIEDIMDSLIQGFEKQLDMLFSAQAMDINSDIEVLESMMAVDGLKENEFSMKRTSKR